MGNSKVVFVSIFLLMGFAPVQQMYAQPRYECDKAQILLVLKRAPRQFEWNDSSDVFDKAIDIINSLEWSQQYYQIQTVVWTKFMSKSEEITIHGGSGANMLEELYGDGDVTDTKVDAVNKIEELRKSLDTEENNFNVPIVSRSYKARIDVPEKWLLENTFQKYSWPNNMGGYPIVLVITNDSEEYCPVCKVNVCRGTLNLEAPGMTPSWITSWLADAPFREAKKRRSDIEAYLSDYNSNLGVSFFGLTTNGWAKVYLDKTMTKEKKGGKPGKSFSYGSCETGEVASDISDLIECKA